MYDYQHQFGIIIIGDSMCGKTALATRFTSAEYHERCEPTIGIDFSLKIVEINGAKIRLQIWDTAGQERFRSITQAYYRKASGVFLAYDVSDRASFTHLTDWLKLAKKYTDNVIFQVVACKVDFEKIQVVSTEEGRHFAQINGFKFFETSAKDNYNVDNAFMIMAQDIYSRFVPSQLKIATICSQSDLNGRNTSSKKKCSSCAF